MSGWMVKLVAPIGEPGLMATSRLPSPLKSATATAGVANVSKQACVNVVAAAGVAVTIRRSSTNDRTEELGVQRMGHLRNDSSPRRGRSPAGEEVRGSERRAGQASRFAGAEC